MAEETRDDFREDIRRLESKVDKLAEAIGKLILFEERQANQGERISKVEASLVLQDKALLKVDRKVDMWVNRGIGIWVAATIVFTLIQLGMRMSK